LFQAAEVLPALGMPVQWHMSAGVGHSIDPEGLRHGGAFLAANFAGA
jgi:phospholipase/carboxylesterase